MESYLCHSFLLVMFMSVLYTSQAYTFYVGGKDGWVLEPSENYNHWAERNRFQVNDTLVFRYKRGSNSVIIVNKDDYYKCNTADPIQTLSDSNQEFKLDRSGLFFFISGNTHNCEKGQKIIVLVLAVRNNATPKALSPVAKTPSPSAFAKPPKSAPPKQSDTPEAPNTSGFDALAPAPSAAAPSFGDFASFFVSLSIGAGVVLCNFGGFF